MSTWVERNLNDIDTWRLSATPAASEDEIAYLFNDIGPLLYVFTGITDEMRQEALT